ncbi:hypothetical protein BDW22DRAFT_1426352 [Trametopsis cervina]|nr:hypothetical protein BDW22DRAFT_1426352 [Trametopsis cervina]
MAGSSTDSHSLVNFDEYNGKLQASALKATRNAVSLPNDLGFYRTMDRGIAEEVDTCSSRVLALANRLLDLVATGDSSRVNKAKGKMALEHDDIVDTFRSSVVDAMDQLMERADTCLDEFRGLTKPPAIAVNPEPKKQKAAKKPTASSGRLDPVIQHASHLPKPQLKFRRKVNNDDALPWRPTLRHKYNAQVPLGYDLKSSNEGDVDSSPHPYRHEIKNISYPSHMFVYAEPIPPKSFEETPFKWVETLEELAAMLDELRQAKEIAIDLEYHSYRSFTGFVCLMQISTRKRDWVVDTLVLRDELEDLNEVFTDPAIVKVFHGADSDIVWLQQDFNLYIVNLFDTYHASKILDFPRHALATLMEMYCDFTPDKRYQLADWRIRPLPEAMLNYARSDTHFLLFIYDNLRNALIDCAQSRAASRAQSPAEPQAGTSTGVDPSHALVREVLSRSQDTALRVYEQETYDAETGSGPSGWDTLARKWNKAALMAGERDSARRRIYRAVHAWREHVAREEDESTRYVVPNHQLFVLAEQAPRDMASLLSLFQHAPAIIRRRAKELLDTIHEASKEDVVPPEATTSQPSVVETVEVVMTAVEEVKENTVQFSQGTHDVRLWPTGGRKINVSSSLFGANLGNINTAKSGKRTLFISERSSLFSDSTPSQPVVNVQAQRVRDVVARIHGGLSIAPAMPSLPAASASIAAEESGNMEVVPETITEQVEIPFVPANERQDKRAAVVETVADTIVVVGQPQRKKRKREKKAADVSNVQRESEQPAADAEFDYSTVSNILDEGSDHEPAGPVGGPRKRKQKGQGHVDHGGFRAPPKAPSEVRRGNQSRTFR